jgi:hypothetical protein
MPKKKPRKGSRAVGRPTVFTEEVVRKLEEAFSMDCTDEEACAYAGIGERTYYDHKAADEAFSQRVERAKQFCFVLAKKTVLKAMQDDDGALAMKWLKNRQRDRYHEKVEQDVKQTTVEEVISEVEQGTEYTERFTPEQPSQPA